MVVACCCRLLLLLVVVAMFAHAVRILLTSYHFPLVRLPGLEDNKLLVA